MSVCPVLGNSCTSLKNQLKAENLGMSDKSAFVKYIRSRNKGLKIKIIANLKYKEVFYLSLLEINLLVIVPHLLRGCSDRRLAIQLFLLLVSLAW